MRSRERERKAVMNFHAHLGASYASAVITIALQRSIRASRPKLSHDGGSCVLLYVHQLLLFFLLSPFLSLFSSVCVCVCASGSPLNGLHRHHLIIIAREAAIHAGARI